MVKVSPEERPADTQERDGIIRDATDGVSARKRSAAISIPVPEDQGSLRPEAGIGRQSQHPQLCTERLTCWTDLNVDSPRDNRASKSKYDARIPETCHCAIRYERKEIARV